MGNLLLIGLGGALGAMARYWLGGRVQALSGSFSFPYGTLAVNVLGAFLLGFLAYLVEGRGLLTPEARALLMVGLLGAFTTFSTFGLETLNLLREGQTTAALANIGASLLLSLLAVWAGRYLPELLRS